MVGHIAIKLLIHIDFLTSKIKKSNDQKKNKDELDKISGGAEAECERMNEHLI